MGQAQINVRTRACSRTSIARTKQAALTHNVRGKELTIHKLVIKKYLVFLKLSGDFPLVSSRMKVTDTASIDVLVMS